MIVDIGGELYGVLLPRYPSLGGLPRHIFIDWFVAPATFGLAFCGLFFGFKQRDIYNLRISKPWLAIASGVLWGTVLCFCSLAYISLTGVSHRSVGENMNYVFSNLPLWRGYFVYFLVTSVFLEETIFRSLLWGVLRRLGFDDWNHTGLNVLCIQALVFWSIHFRYALNHLLSFWMLTLFIGFALGALAWRERSILSSMIAHAMLDVIVYIVSFNV